MRLWLRYIKEKRITLLLYAGTVFFFVAVGSMYHIENLEKLLYAAFLTSIIWGIAGLWDGYRYVKRSTRLERNFAHFGQSKELLFTEDESLRLQETEGNIMNAADLDTARLLFLSSVREEYARERREQEERSRERRDYYTMWTHQIKTPISAVKLLLEESGLQNRTGFLLREELFKIEQYAGMALTYQRLESLSSDLVLASYGLDALVKQAVRKYSILFINKSLSLELGELSYEVLTDEKWLVLCLEQLLSNSVKYTNQGSISFEAARRGDRVLLTLEDTGIGIRSEDLPRIFERGFTGYNGRLDKKSTGIGLYLCRQIFTHLNVTVRVESEVGKGTKVLLGIPCPKNAVRD